MVSLVMSGVTHIQAGQRCTWSNQDLAALRVARMDRRIAFDAPVGVVEERRGGGAEGRWGGGAVRRRDTCKGVKRKSSVPPWPG